jgi:hypothetical protein
VHVLNDGTFPFPAAYFFHNVSQATWREHVRADAHGKVPVAHHCALVESDRELMLIDTGYGSDTHDGRTGHVLEQLALAGYRREQVSHVVLTHAHGDQIKGCTFVQEGERHPTFPNACYHLARADWDWFGGAAQPLEFSDHLVSVQRMVCLPSSTRRCALVRRSPCCPRPVTPRVTPASWWNRRAAVQSSWATCAITPCTSRI